ncbi:hypothetical protein [Amycolatopsis sp. cmx-4-54]|uniref:hypothetical protein n=1 Tax=Amycolatopsis sp. cmx-4-54 TaxID=2790936 RepID=UPI00397A49D9
MTSFDTFPEPDSGAEFDDHAPDGRRVFDMPNDADTFDPNAYQHCYECGRIYPTEADLINAYVANGDAKTPTPASGAKISFCPECLHDFLYMPQCTWTANNGDQCTLTPGHDMDPGHLIIDVDSISGRPIYHVHERKIYYFTDDHEPIKPAQPCDVHGDGWGIHQPVFAFEDCQGRVI